RSAAATQAGDASRSLANQESWTEFRGPTGQGISAARQLPLQWASDAEKSSKNIVWKKPIPGQAWSSPVVQAGRLYLTTAVTPSEKAGLSLRALCLNAGTGNILWDTEVISLP